MDERIIKLKAQIISENIENARFMDLEELDFNISSILDKLIESTKD